jgi:protein-tyrosine phosphatase
MSATSIDRHLPWEGAFNARDLGGLPIVGGGRTRRGALVRSDALDGLTAAGWEAVLDHGVRTVIDLRNDTEREPDAAPRPDAVMTLHRPLDAVEDRSFWDVWDRGPQFGTPRYYRPHLERFPERSAAVLSAIARAAPGGVVVHCGGGRDRAGQVSLLVLALAGVEPQAIGADYGLSFERLPARYAAHGEPDQGPELRAHLAERGTTAEALVAELATTLDVAALLGPAGLTGADVAALRDRIVEPA